MKFSIVIANFNSGTLLKQCLESVFSQNYTDYEVIMVDADSTDESKQILLEYKDKFAWWCTEKDKGQSDAFNKGFAHAKGDFFFWLNADDLLLPGALKAASEYLDKHPKCKWLTFDTIFIDINRKVQFVNYGTCWKDIFTKYVGPEVNAPTSIYHRSLFESSNKFDLELYYAMDTDLWYQFMDMGYKFERLHFFFYAFRIHKGSKTTDEGFNAKTTNPKKIQQARLLESKHPLVHNKFMTTLNAIIKVFTCKKYTWYYNAKLKGKII